MNKNTSDKFRALLPFALAILLTALSLYFFSHVVKTDSLDATVVVDRNSKQPNMSLSGMRSRYAGNNIDALVARVKDNGSEVELYGRDTGRSLVLSDCLDNLCFSKLPSKYTAPESIEYSFSGKSKCGKDYRIFFETRVIGPISDDLYNHLLKNSNPEIIDLIGAVGSYRKQEDKYFDNKFLNKPIMEIGDATLRYVLFPDEYQSLDQIAFSFAGLGDEFEKAVSDTLDNPVSEALKKFSDSIYNQLSEVSEPIQIHRDLIFGYGTPEGVLYLYSSYKEGDSMQRLLESNYIKDIFTCKGELPK